MAKRSPISASAELLYILVSFFLLCLLSHAVNGSELRKVLFLTPSVCCFLLVHEISRKPLKGFAPNSQGRRVWCLAWTTLKIKARSQRSRSPWEKNCISWPFCRPTCDLCLAKHLYPLVYCFVVFSTVVVNKDEHKITNI